MRRRTLDLTSNRLAFMLMASLVLLMVLSAVIPQQNISQSQILDWHETLGPGYGVIERLGLDRIYFSPPFFVVLALLGVNLAAANIKRFRLVYRVEGTLLRLRHLGSIVFHLALILIMVAVILNYLFKFEGAFAMTEGQTETTPLLKQFLAEENKVRCPKCRKRLRSAESGRCPRCDRKLQLGLIWSNSFGGWWAASLYGTSLASLLSLLLLERVMAVGCQN